MVHEGISLSVVVCWKFSAQLCRSVEGEPFRGCWFLLLRGVGGSDVAIDVGGAQG